MPNIFLLTYFCFYRNYGKPRKNHERLYPISTHQNLAYLIRHDNFRHRFWYSVLSVRNQSQWLCPCPISRQPLGVSGGFLVYDPCGVFSVFLGAVAHEHPKYAVFCHLDLGEPCAVFLSGGVMASCGRVATKNARHRQTVARQWRHRPTPILLGLCQKMGIGRLSCVFGGIGDCVFNGI